jgi:hypothetical protein
MLGLSSHSLLQNRGFDRVNDVYQVSCNCVQVRLDLAMNLWSRWKPPALSQSRVCSLIGRSMLVETFTSVLNSLPTPSKPICRNICEANICRNLITMMMLVSVARGMDVLSKHNLHW